MKVHKRATIKISIVVLLCLLASMVYSQKAALRDTNTLDALAG